MSFLILAALLLPFISFAKNSVTVWPLPDSEIKSTDYQVDAGGKLAFVSTAKVLRGRPASFSSFDFSGSVQVKVKPSTAIKSFKILPTSAGIKGVVLNGQLIFTLTQAANLTIEFNGNIEAPLHLFAGALEVSPPGANDSKVIYFGPGLHEVSTLHPENGQTIYLAPGAVLRAVIPADEEPREIVDRDGQQEKVYAPLIEAGGKDKITIRGRGIIDLSGLPWHARKAIWFDQSTNILIEGITLLDAPDWGVVMHQCSNVTVRNIKEIAARENSDGIDICNSQTVVVEDSFIRCNDDGVAIKTLSPPPALISKNITVRRCVIWNERARALGITSETLADISNVTFQNCDIIHDLSEGGDCAAMAVLVSDSGTVSSILFDTIRVESCQNKLLRCWIGGDGWSQDSNRGKIKGVTFKNINVTGNVPLSEVYGYDPTHLADTISLNLKVNGKLIRTAKDANLNMNEFTKLVRVTLL